MACNIINDMSELRLPSQYDSKKFYLIKWKSDNKITVVNGWNLNAIKHRDFKENYTSVIVLREATKEDIEKYGIS